MLVICINLPLPPTYTRAQILWRSPLPRLSRAARAAHYFRLLAGGGPRPCATRALRGRSTRMTRDRHRERADCARPKPWTTSNAQRRLCAVDGSAPHITPAPAGQLPQPWGTLFQLVLLNATLDPTPTAVLNVSDQEVDWLSIRCNITLLDKGRYRGKGETPVARFLRGRVAWGISAPRFLWLQVWGNFAT